MVGVLYVLDEPSIGLHPRDQRRSIHSQASNAFATWATRSSWSSTTRTRWPPITSWTLAPVRVCAAVRWSVAGTPSRCSRSRRASPHNTSAGVVDRGAGPAARQPNGKSTAYRRRAAPQPEGDSQSIFHRGVRLRDRSERFEPVVPHQRCPPQRVARPPPREAGTGHSDHSRRRGEKENDERAK